MKLRFHTKPWPHQKLALKFVMKYKRCGLDMGMGTGKTKVAIDLIINKGHTKTLIVCPATVLDVWPEEFKIHSGEEFNFYTLKGTIMQKIGMLKDAKKQGGKSIILVSYDSVWRLPLAKHLKSFEFDQVIFDESHRVKTPSAKVSNFCHTLAKHIPNVLIMSGTMFGDKLTDIYGQFKIMDDSIFGTRFDDFKCEYFRMGGFMGREIKGVLKPRTLARRVASRTYHVSKEAVLILPPAIDIYRYTELSGNAKRLYKELKDDMVAKIGEELITIKNVLAKSVSLQRITSGAITKTNEETGEKTIVEVDRSKIALCKDVIEDLPKNEPIIILCKFHHDIDNVIAMCKQTGRSYSELSGRVNGYLHWKAGKSNVLVVQIRAGAEGISLVRAKYCIYYSIGHSLNDYHQSRARIHRPGQVQNVTYIHLLVKNTIDVAIRKALTSKEDMINAIMEEIKKQ